tara:strand:- start:33046 stop:33996 length:951 start_codon:yes stop_codon:yes gene_type:complete
MTQPSISSQAIRVGLFFIFGAALLFLMRETLSDKKFTAEEGYQVQAPFQNLRQLKVGDAVRMAGVQVGTVVNARLKGSRAVADLSIGEEYEIPQDSVATILSIGLLGANYVAITPGGHDQVLKDGEVIKTKESADLSTAIAQFGSITERVDRFLADLEGGTIGGEGGLFGEVNGFFNENKDKLAKIFDNLEVITTRVAEGEGTLGKLATSEELYANLIDLTEKIGTIVDNFDEGEGALGLLMNNEEIADKLRKTVDDFSEFAAKLNSEESTLGKLATTDDLYQQAEGVIHKVERTVDNFENTGPITAVGVAASVLF